MVDWTKLAEIDQQIKSRMEQIWRAPGIAYPNNITGWRLGATNLVALKGHRYPPVKSRWRKPASRGLSPEGLRILRSYHNDQQRSHKS